MNTEIRYKDLSLMHSHMFRRTLYIHKLKHKQTFRDKTHCVCESTFESNLNQNLNLIVKHTNREYIWKNMTPHTTSHTHTCAHTPRHYCQSNCNLCCSHSQLPSFPHKPDQHPANSYSHNGVQLQHDSE